MAHSCNQNSSNLHIDTHANVFKAFAWGLCFISIYMLYIFIRSIRNVLLRLFCYFLKLDCSVYMGTAKTRAALTMTPHNNEGNTEPQSNRYMTGQQRGLITCLYTINVAITELHRVSNERRANSHQYEELEAVYRDVYYIMHDAPLDDAYDILRDTSIKPRLNTIERTYLEDLRTLKLDMDHAWALLIDNDAIPLPFGTVDDESYKPWCDENKQAAWDNIDAYALALEVRRG